MAGAADWHLSEWAFPTTDARFCVTVAKDTILGSGAFGLVCRAEYYGKPCAAKTFHALLNPELFGMHIDHEGRSRLVADIFQEMHMLSRMHHPCVLPLIGVAYEEFDSVLLPKWIIAPLMDESLDRLLYAGDRSPLTELDVAVLALDICSGLCYLHSHKVAHRDVKPKNILVHCAGAMLCDMGASKIIQALDNTMLTGTAPYAAAEVITRTHDPLLLDIYALGVTLVELCLAERPVRDGHSFPEDDPRWVEQKLRAGLAHPGLAPLIAGCCNVAAERLPAAALCGIARAAVTRLRTGGAGGDVGRPLRSVQRGSVNLRAAQGDVDATRAQLAAVTAERDGLRVELDAMREQVARLTIEYNRAQLTILEQDEGIASLRGLAEGQEAVISSMTLGAAAREGAHTSLTQRHDELRTENARLRGLLDGQVTANAQLMQGLDTSASTTERLLEALAEARAVARDLTDTATDDAQLRVALNSQRQTLAELKSLLSDSKHEIVGLLRVNVELEAACDEQRGLVDTHTRVIRELRRTVDNQQAAIDELESARIALRSKTEQQESQILELSARAGSGGGGGAAMLDALALCDNSTMRIPPAASPAPSGTPRSAQSEVEMDLQRRLEAAKREARRYRDAVEGRTAALASCAVSYDYQEKLYQALNRKFDAAKTANAALQGELEGNVAMVARLRMLAISQCTLLSQVASALERKRLTTVGGAELRPWFDEHWALVLRARDVVVAWRTCTTLVAQTATGRHGSTEQEGRTAVVVDD